MSKRKSERMEFWVRDRCPTCESEWPDESNTVPCACGEMECGETDLCCDPWHDSPVAAGERKEEMAGGSRAASGTVPAAVQTTVSDARQPVAPTKEDGLMLNKPIPRPTATLIEALRDHLIWTSGLSIGDPPPNGFPTDSLWGENFRRAMRHLDALEKLIVE